MARKLSYHTKQTAADELPTLPEEILHALLSTLPIRDIRYAHPFLSHGHKKPDYFQQVTRLSDIDADRAFGIRAGNYDSPWLHTLSLPPPDPDHICKALRWALGSFRLEDQLDSFTILAVPRTTRKHTPRVSACLRQPECRHIATVTHHAPRTSQQDNLHYRHKPHTTEIWMICSSPQSTQLTHMNATPQSIKEALTLVRQELATKSDQKTQLRTRLTRSQRSTERTFSPRRE